jgi:hypothetical protein
MTARRELVLHAVAAIFAVLAVLSFERLERARAPAVSPPAAVPPAAVATQSPSASVFLPPARHEVWLQLQHAICEPVTSALGVKSYRCCADQGALTGDLVPAGSMEVGRHARVMMCAFVAWGDPA